MATRDAPDSAAAAGNEKPTIVVVEDNLDLLDDLVEYFDDRGYTTTGVADAESFRDVFIDSEPDLVVLDLILPGEDGLSIARWIRNVSDVGILILTCRDTPRDQIAGLEAGADAYLSKDAALDVIEATAWSILRRLGRVRQARQPAAPAAPAPAVEIWRFDAVASLVGGPNGRTAKLTGVERSFLRPLMRNPGELVGREALLGSLGKADTESSRRNLDAIARRLRRKVEKEIGAELPLDTVYGRGYVFAAQAVVEDA